MANGCSKKMWLLGATQQPINLRSFFRSNESFYGIRHDPSANGTDFFVPAEFISRPGLTY